MRRFLYGAYVALLIGGFAVFGYNALQPDVSPSSASETVPRTTLTLIATTTTTTTTTLPKPVPTGTRGYVLTAVKGWDVVEVTIRDGHIINVTGQWRVERQETYEVTETKYRDGGTYRVGAECRDGWDSTATGRGACSWHGGVAYWKTRTEQIAYDVTETHTRTVWDTTTETLCAADCDFADTPTAETNADVWKWHKGTVRAFVPERAA